MADVQIHRLTLRRLGRNPPSRTRHHMSNVRVSETDNPDELDVRSYVLVHRNRTDTPAADLFSAERQDIIRRADGRLRLARRLIVPDQAVVGARHLAILLQHSWRRSAERSDRA